jgi:hypothetical protein
MSEPTATEQVTVAELDEIMVELQKYRDRLVNDTLETIQRAKLPKAKSMAQIEPELAKIDEMMADLQDRKAALTGTN